MCVGIAEQRYTALYGTFQINIAWRRQWRLQARIYLENLD